MPIPFEFDFKNPDYTSVFVHRQQRLKALRANPEKLPMIKAFYKNNPAQFIIDWGCTFDPRNVERGLPAIVPFLLFERQEEWVRWCLEKWKGQKDGCAVKCRDMGLSWLSVGLASTMCMFNEGLIIGFGSRKEEYVDKKGFPKSLFYKARLFSNLVPREFRAGYNEATTAPHMRVTYPQTDSALMGESGDGIGRGDRASIYFVDEAAFLERPQLTEASLSMTTNCRIDISTVNGSNNPFAEKITSSNVDTFRFRWQEDPRKDQAWYDKQVIRLDPVTLAQEVNMDINASVESVLIPSAWVQSAIDAHIKLGVDYAGEKTSALDVADLGKDECAQAFRNGILLEDIRSWHGKTVEDIHGSTDKAFDNCDERGYRILRFDSDGLGAGVRGAGRVLNEERAGEIEVVPYHGSGAVINKDDPMFEDDDSAEPRTKGEFFKNYKSQSWWSLRERFKITHEAVTKGLDFEDDEIISISSNCSNLTQLTTQLSQVTYSKDGKGRVVVDKAPDGAKSPNDADSVVICYAPEKEAQEFGLIF